MADVVEIEAVVNAISWTVSHCGDVIAYGPAREKWTYNFAMAAKEIAAELPKQVKLPYRTRRPVEGVHLFVPVERKVLRALEKRANWE